MLNKLNSRLDITETSYELNSDITDIKPVRKVEGISEEICAQSAEQRKKEMENVIGKCNTCWRHSNNI